MIKSLLKYKNTFERLKKYLTLQGYSKTFNGLSEIEKVIILLNFLQSIQVPVISALMYYNLDYPTAKFEDKLKNLVVKEFYRIENNIECNYVPF